MKHYEKEIYKCISGENEGKLFVHFDSYSMREVVNGKVNRYPYFSTTDNEVIKTGELINYHNFNTQLTVNFDDKQGVAYNVLKIISKRLIEYEIDKNKFDQFIINIIEHNNHLGKYIVFEVYSNQVALFNLHIADITYHIDTDTYYVLHEKIHPPIRNSYNHIMEETYTNRDHRVFGYIYKKPVYKIELEVFNKMLIVSNNEE